MSARALEAVKTVVVDAEGIQYRFVRRRSCMTRHSVLRLSRGRQMVQTQQQRRLDRGVRVSYTSGPFETVC